MLRYIVTKPTSSNTTHSTSRITSAPFSAYYCGTYLVKHHPLHVANHVSSLVQHGPQDLGGADQAGGGGVDLDVSGEQSHLHSTTYAYWKSGVANCTNSLALRVGLIWTSPFSNNHTRTSHVYVHIVQE